MNIGNTHTKEIINYLNEKEISSMRIYKAKIIGKRFYEKDGRKRYIYTLIFAGVPGCEGFIGGEMLTFDDFPLEKEVEIIYGYSDRTKRFGVLGLAERS